MHIRSRQILCFGGLFTVLLTCPVLPQVRKDDNRGKCPGGISFGILNDRAIEMPAPVYPEKAKKRGVTGTVVVFVVVDEEGRVSKARACAGPRELRRPAEDAAYKARLRPTILSGVAVENRGALTYAFPQKEKSHDPEAAPNNGMHPTRISLEAIRKIGCLRSCVRAGDAGR